MPHFAIAESQGNNQERRTLENRVLRRIFVCMTERVNEKQEKTAGRRLSYFLLHILKTGGQNEGEGM